MKIIRCINFIIETMISWIFLLPYVLVFTPFFGFILSGRNISLVFIVFFAPILILWVVILWRRGKNAKYYSGVLKLFFAVGTNPLVMVIYYINFTSENDNINIFVALMTSFFFTIDGISDLVDVFDYYYEIETEEQIKQHKYEVYMKALRRLVLGLLIIFYIPITVLTYFLYHSINSIPIEIDNWIDFFNGVMIYASCWSLGWFFYFFQVFRFISKTFTKEVYSIKGISSHFTRLNRSLYNKGISIYIFPIISTLLALCFIFIRSICLINEINEIDKYVYLMEIKAMAITLLGSIISWVTTSLIQTLLQKRNII